MDRARLSALAALYGATLIDEAGPTDSTGSGLTGNNRYPVTRLIGWAESPVYAERDIKTASGRNRKTRNRSRWKQ